MYNLSRSAWEYGWSSRFMLLLWHQLTVLITDGIGFYPTAPLQFLQKNSQIAHFNLLWRKDSWFVLYLLCFIRLFIYYLIIFKELPIW